MIRLKCDSFDTDIGIEMMKSKNKDKGKISITFLLFTVLTLYPCMPSQPFGDLRVSDDSFRLI